MDNNLQSNSVVDDFFAELGKDADLQKLGDMLKAQPDLLVSDDFLRKTFPKHSNEPDALGRVNVDKMMQVVEIVTKMEKNGLISSEQLQAFLDAKNPDIGETMATFVAKNAVVAYDKAFIDRSPNDNFPPEDRQAFEAQSNVYANALSSLEKSGANLALPNENGETLTDIASMATVKNDKGNSPVLSQMIERIPSNQEELEVGATEQEKNNTALKVKVADNKKEALKVKALPDKPEEEIKEATVEDAPEEEGGNSSDYNASAVKEQDIIDYMYNAWFLGSLNWGINKIVGNTCNAIDNLCDKKIKKKSNNNVEKKEQKPVKKVEEFQKKSQELLDTAPKSLTNSFSDNLRNRKSLIKSFEEDTLDNCGKKNQKWKMFDVNNPQQKKEVESINALYAKNPKEFRDKVSNLSDNFDKFEGLGKRIYTIASEMATIQYLNNHMKNEKTELPNLDDVKVKESIQKLANKNFQSIMSASSAVAEHTKLASMLRDKEKDKIVISENSAKSSEMYLSLLEQQTAKAKVSLLDDIREGNFALNKKEVSRETSSNIGKIDKLISDGEKQWEVLMPTERKEAGLSDLKSTAQQFNSDNLLSGTMLKDIGQNIASIEAQKNTNSERKNKINAYKKKLANNHEFANFDRNNQNADTNAVGNIIISARRRNRE